MSRSRTLSRLMLPSYFSTMASLCIIVFIVIVNIWTSIVSYPFFRQLSNILEERVTLIDSDKSTLSAIYDALFYDSIFNDIFFLLFWALVGILAYFAYVVATKGFDSFKDFVNISFVVNVSRFSFLKEVVSRIFLRLTTMLISVGYTIFFFQVVLPVASVSFKAGSPARTVTDWQFLVFGVMVLSLSLYLYTIIIRLLFLRVRVFGGGDEIILYQ